MKTRGLGAEIRECRLMAEEAPPGFEPGMADLQSQSIRKVPPEVERCIRSFAEQLGAEVIEPPDLTVDFFTPAGKGWRERGSS